jgi:hypothetical protein
MASARAVCEAASRTNEVPRSMVLFMPEEHPTGAIGQP